MSGASSTYVDGYMKDTERALLKRKDLDINELISLCILPSKQEDRISELRRYSEVYPELKYFLIVAYFFKDAFTQLNSTGPIDYQPSNTKKGGSPENISSMWKQVMRMYDTFPTGPRTKRSIAQQLLPSLYKEDALLIKQLIEGKFYSKELNEVVVAKAFPNEVPADPKV